ncbi:MAG TPA: YeiH family protein [Lachnospiraceae bacterium]|nr:YeiH family protein [Lachnospiraceae bacterium]
MKCIKEKGKGIILCLAITIPICLLVRSIHQLDVIGAPIIAIVVGMILTAKIRDKSIVQDGINFTSKKILQYAVILLGFGLNLATVGKVGSTSLPIILSTISISLVMAYIMYKVLNIQVKTSMLIGIGSCICGGSAIAATAPIIDANDEEIAQSISVIFLFNVIAAILFPSLGSILGLSNNGFGLFAGTAINDTSSVTAAASTWDTLHGTNGSVLAYATVVKLTRTLAIIPISLVLSYIRIKKERKTSNITSKKVSIEKVFPMFILYFILASIITTIITNICSGITLTYANHIFTFFKHLSKFFIVMAMSAIGLNTDIVKLVKKGGKPILMGFCCWISITLVSIVMQNLLHIL